MCRSGQQTCTCVQARTQQAIAGGTARCVPALRRCTLRRWLEYASQRSMYMPWRTLRRSHCSAPFASTSLNFWVQGAHTSAHLGPATTNRTIMACLVRAPCSGSTRAPVLCLPGDRCCRSLTLCWTHPQPTKPVSQRTSRAIARLLPQARPCVILAHGQLLAVRWCVPALCPHHRALPATCTTASHQL